MTIFLILVSTSAFILETISELSNISELWDTIEIIVSIAFSIEYILRFISCNAFGDTKWNFIKSKSFSVILRASQHSRSHCYHAILLGAIFEECLWIDRVENCKNCEIN